MKRFLLLCLSALCIAVRVTGQSHPVPEYNFNFEQIHDGNPVQWTSFGGDGYRLVIDDQNRHSGNYSACIEFQSDSAASYKAWSLEIPGSYQGKQITLTGYLKTEHVTDGFAGLWMRIDPNVAMDNMYDRGVVGTTDWTQYSITLPLNPAMSRQIAIGGLLVGRGKLWIDDLQITIDGKAIEDWQLWTPLAAQDKEFDAGSQISTIPVDAGNIRALKQLGLIWGFLKYYHPAIAEGNRNWDYELFRMLPQVIDERDQAVRDKTIAAWINGLGALTENTSAVDMKDAKLLPDLTWIDDSGFSKELVAILKKVQHAQRSGINYYVCLFPGAGNPQFINENPYANLNYPDAGYRMLSLFRYWNMMQYYNPNRHLIGEDWKGVLEEFIPRFAAAKDETEYVLTTLEIIARVHDTHANLWMTHPVLDQFKGRFLTAPIVSFVEGKAVVIGFFKGKSVETTGLTVGDVITRINDRTVDEIVRGKLKLTPASNYSTQLRDIARNLLRTNESEIRIVYTRDGQSTATTLKSYPGSDLDPYLYPQPESSFRMLDDQIAYLFPGLLKQGEGARLWQQIENTSGLVIDMRCYPTDFIVRSLGPQLFPHATPFVKLSKGSVVMPGLFTFTEPLVVGEENPNYYKGKIVVLINEITQSQAEYTTMALRLAPDVTVVGSTTSGADGNVSEILLPGGLRTLVSGIGIYYPDGRETQRVGILPDIELRPTLCGIAQGRDELLEKAVALIKK